MYKKYIVRLSDEERRVCHEVVKKLKGSSQKARRAQIARVNAAAAAAAASAQAAAVAAPAAAGPVQVVNLPAAHVVTRTS